jgi:hypothetical protein
MNLNTKCSDVLLFEFSSQVAFHEGCLSKECKSAFKVITGLALKSTNASKSDTNLSSTTIADEDEFECGNTRGC